MNAQKRAARIRAALFCETVGKNEFEFFVNTRAFPNVYRVRALEIDKRPDTGWPVSDARKEVVIRLNSTNNIGPGLPGAVSG